MPRTVIISFGLRAHTRRTVELARTLGHPVHLVAALPPARRGLGAHRSRLVTVHDEVGRDGLAAAVDGVDDDAVLLLHEDVLLDPAAARRLLAVSAADPRAVVVPLLNHRDVDGAAGTLPPDVVQPLRPHAEPRPVERIRPVVLAATGDRLRRLLPHRLTAGASRLHLPALLAPDVVATHLDEGRDVELPPVGPDGRPLLVASMIVRDEERFLPDCLASLAPIVDRIDVCDTGSSDRTREIVTAAGAQLIEREWRDDFAWARNEVLELSRDAWWVLHVDADERAVVEDADALRRFLATAIHDGEAFDVPLRDITEGGVDVGGMQLPRLFRPDGVRFRGAVHEVPRNADGSLVTFAVCNQLTLHHLGYRADVIADRDKLTRNIRIARADHDEHGNDLTGLQLARSLSLSADSTAEVLAVVEPIARRVSARTDVLNEQGHVSVYQLHAKALRAAGRLEEAFASAAEGRQRYPHAPLLRSLHASLGVATGRLDEVAAIADEDVADAARPWSIPTADVSRLVDQARAQFATGDEEAARRSLDELLASPVLALVDRWTEITSLVAVLMGEGAIGLLLGLAAADGSGGALRAAASLLEEEDRAAFAGEVVDRVDVAGPGLAAAAVELVGDAADVTRLEKLAEQLDEDAIDGLWLRVRELPAPVRTWLRDRAIDAPSAHGETDVESMLTALAAGDTSLVADAVTWTAATQTVARARIVAGEVPAAIASTVLRQVVTHGHHTPDVVHVALAVAVVAGDHDAIDDIARSLEDEVEPAVLDSLVGRARGRGDEATARALATMAGRTAA